MAKKPTRTKADRSNPKVNKSLAVRLTLKKMPGAKASAIAEAVKKEFGHKITANMVYMVKTKLNMVAARPGKTKKAKSNGRPKTAALWVDAIKTARQLLKATGSRANATALLKALDS
jgi:hypothetical protein